MNAAIPTVRRGSVIGFLSDPKTYPDRPDSVQLVETHISWVFLTDQFAYKLKKPVRFEFLDFSTPELRHQACLDEVRLNRRLAADVYLKVLPITKSSTGRLELDGHGQLVDWVVQMRRLPAERNLGVLVREKKVRSEEISSLAAHLANFYVHALPKTTSPERYLAAFERHIRANGAVLLNAERAPRFQIRKVQSAQLRYLILQSQEFEKRVASGRIFDGHGDLRPEHVYLEKVPAVIDCIEFSEELREVDIADELSFLAMECERLGDRTVGELIFNVCERACGDDANPSLQAFYRAYRACVRAKVAILRSEHQKVNNRGESGDEIRDYLHLAERYSKDLGPPLLLTVGGLMGTGKSTLATQIAKAFDIDVLSTDQLRRELLGASESPAAYGEGNYGRGLRERIYRELLESAGRILDTGQSVVLDGTFLTDGLRTQAFDVAYAHHAAFLYIHCTCQQQLALARIQQRANQGQSESEARTELYDFQAREFEPLCADDPAITIDTALTMEHQLEVAYGTLRRLLF